MHASRSWGRIKYVLYCRVSVARQPAGDVCVSYSRANSCPSQDFLPYILLHWRNIPSVTVGLE